MNAMDFKDIISHINAIFSDMHAETSVSESGFSSRSVCVSIQFQSEEEDWFADTFKKVNGSKEVDGDSFTIQEGERQYTVNCVSYEFRKISIITYACFWTDEWSAKQARKRSLMGLLDKYEEDYRKASGAKKLDYAECIQGIINELDKLMATM